MKLYLVTDGERQHWAGTERDARHAVRDLRKAGYKAVEFELVDVPTDKAGLLAFLNYAAKEAEQ